MRIGILAKGGDHWIGGLHYTLNLVRALCALPPAEQPRIVLWIRADQAVEPFREVIPWVELCRLPVVSGSRGPGTRSGFSRLKTCRSSAATDPALVRVGAALVEKRLDVIFPCMRSMGPAFPIRWLPWVPDLQHRCLPAFFSAAERRRRDVEFERMAADATLAVLSSRSAVADFDRFFPGYHAKLRVLHFTSVLPREWYECDARPTVRRYSLPARYLMLPGQFWVHKNHRLVLEAMEILMGRGLNVPLVCTGRTEDPRRRGHFERLRGFISDHGLSDRIHILGLLPRFEQVQLMRAATAIVHPSLFEGWSTVVEDARALGKRIFLSDIAVHREQRPPGAVFFDPAAAGTLADEIARVWNVWPAGRDVPAERKAREAGRRRGSGYARRFLSLVDEVLGVTQDSRTPCRLGPEPATQSEPRP